MRTITSAGAFTMLAATLFVSPVWARLLYDPVDLADEFQLGIEDDPQGSNNRKGRER